jgi:hypothetical protein
MQTLYEFIIFRYPFRKERTRAGGRDEKILLSLFDEIQATYCQG